MRRLGHLLCTRCLYLALFLPGLVPNLGGPVLAGEPFREMLDGLKNRQDFELALTYLDVIEKSTFLDDANRALLPYERGQVLVAYVATIRDVRRRSSILDKADETLQGFVTANPDHPSTPAANMLLGQVLVERAKDFRRKANNEADAAKKEPLLTTAKEALTKARGVFEQAEAKFFARLEELKGLKDDPAAVAEQQSARGHRIDAMLYVAGVVAELADFYPAEAPERNQLLQEAADKYGVIYEKYNVLLGGLAARVNQARCLQQKGEFGLAVKYLDPVLIDPNPDPSFKRVQAQAMKYSIQCWLAPSENKALEAFTRGNQWLEELAGLEDADPLVTDVRWQVIQAGLKLKDTLKDDVPEEAKQKEEVIVRCVALLRKVAKVPSDYRDEARGLLVEFNKLRPEALEVEPQNFSEARAAAHEAVSSASAAITAIAERRAEDPNADVTELEQQRAEALLEAINRAKRALQMQDKETPPEELFAVLYEMSYCYLQRGDNYDAAVAAEFIARRYPQNSNAMAAANFAMTAYRNAYATKPEGADRTGEKNKLVALAAFMQQQWPGTQEANEAAMVPARVVFSEGQRDAALAMLDSIGQDSPVRADADMLAGRALWAIYNESMQMPAESRPAADLLEGQKQRAKEMLAKGTAAILAKTAEGGTRSADLLRSEMVLARILNLDGDFAASMALLERPDSGLLALVSVNDPTLASITNAHQEVYTLALRSYIGVQQLEKAETTMAALEALVQGQNASALTALYLQLGKGLQQEIDRLQQAGDAEGLAKARESFKTFVSRIASRESGQTYNSLRWAAESLKGLAGGSPDDFGKLAANDPARPFLEEAARIYDTILKSPNLGGPPEAQVAVKINLASCFRRIGKFQEALDLLASVLKEKHLNLDAQIEAAFTYQAWAEENGAYYTQAMFGGRRAKKPDGTIFNLVLGWNELGRMLQRQPKYKEQFHNARYWLTWCRVRRALSNPAKDLDKDKELSLADRDVRFIAKMDPQMGGPVLFAKYERLMKEIQGLRNKPQTGLQELIKPASTPAAAASPAASGG